MNRRRILSGLALVIALGPAHAQGVRARPGAPAPAAAPAASQLLRIKSVKADATQSPEVDIRITGSSTAQGKASWLRIRAEYETAELWSEEVTLTYYALLKAKRKEDVGPNGKQNNLFRGTVTYLNVPKGKHYSDMFLHPDSFLRFAGADRSAVEKVAVQVSVGGQVVGEMSDPTDNKRWWEQLSPMPQTLLNHGQTPFGLANLDDHHQIKSENR